MTWWEIAIGTWVGGSLPLAILIGKLLARVPADVASQYTSSSDISGDSAVPHTPQWTQRPPSSSSELVGAVRSATKA